VRLDKLSKNTLDISCIILAGGRGSRLGRDKVRVTVGKKNLFQWVLYRTSFLKGEVIIVTSEKQPLSWLAGYSNYKVLSDIYPGRGPLGGIFTGLTVSRSLYTLVIACDMPFLNQNLLRYMVEIAGDFDVIIPRLNNMVEPLHAVYAKSCLAPIEQMIKQDNLSVNNLLGSVKVRYVDTDEIDRFDPRHLSFFNINTEADLEAARKLVEEEGVTDDKC